MIDKPPLTPAEHITQAKSYLAEGGAADQATAHALIAIAEALIEAQAPQPMSLEMCPMCSEVTFGSDLCRTCHAHHDKHSNDDLLSCPAYTAGDGSIVFSTTHRYNAGGKS